MKYLDDIRILIQNNFPERAVFLENFGNDENVIDQVVLVSEPSLITSQQTLVRLNFSIYVQNEDQQKAYDIATDIALFLNNKRFLGASENNIFHSISAVSPPYYFSNGSKFPIYLTKFNALIVDNQIATYQHNPNQSLNLT